MYISGDKEHRQDTYTDEKKTMKQKFGVSLVRGTILMKRDPLTYFRPSHPLNQTMTHKEYGRKITFLNGTINRTVGWSSVYYQRTLFSVYSFIWFPLV